MGFASFEQSERTKKANPTSIFQAIPRHTSKNTLTPLWVTLQEKAMYFFLLYKLSRILAAPTHSSCIVQWSWRADHSSVAARPQLEQEPK